MKRAVKEKFIDSILDHANTLISIKVLQSKILNEITGINRQRKFDRSRLLRDRLQCLYLLKSRIEYTLPVYIQDAFDEQERLLLPEYQNSDILKYRQLCEFKLSIAELSSVKGYDKLVKFGRYSNLNPSGVVKDHRLSIKTAFSLRLNPDLVAHPANCEFLQFHENIAKSSNCSTTLALLQGDVEKWNKKFPFRERTKRWKEFNEN